MTDRFFLCERLGKAFEIFCALVIGHFRGILRNGKGLSVVLFFLTLGEAPHRWVEWGLGWIMWDPG